MEVDLLLDVGAESLNCCSGYMEYIIEKGLSTRKGRITLIVFKIIGFIFDIVAIGLFYAGPSEEECEFECEQDHSDYDSEWACIDQCSGGSFAGTVGGILVTLFIFDRIFAIPLVLYYRGWKPDSNEKYQRWLNRYIAENEKINSKYGLTSLWYGSLFNFPDFAAKIWIIDTDIVCGNMGCTYIIFTSVEGFILLLFITLSFSNIFGEDAGVAWSQYLLIAVSSCTIGFGVVQHYMNIAYTLRNKSHHKSGIEKPQRQKHVQQVHVQQQMPQYTHTTQQHMPQYAVQQPIPQQPAQYVQPAAGQTMMVRMPNGQMAMVRTMPQQQPQYMVQQQPQYMTQQQPQYAVQQPMQMQQPQQRVIQTTPQPQPVPLDNVNSNERVKKENASCSDQCLYSCGSCCFYFCFLFAGCYGLMFCAMTLLCVISMPLSFI